MPSQAGSTTQRSARRSPRRTRSAPTRSCTPRSAPEPMELVDDLAALTADLVSIDSVNPDLIAGAAGEHEIAGFVAEWLDAAGLEVELYEAAAGRPNVVGVARGTGGGRSLLLNAH